VRPAGAFGKAFRVFVTLQSALLAAFVIPVATVPLPGLAHFPQLVAACSLAFGLIAVYPIRLGGWGMAAIYGRLARTRVGKSWVEAHRPFQFAACLLALLVACAERLPGWVPAVVAQLRADMAKHSLGETIVAWAVVGLVALGVALLIVGFVGMEVMTALRPGLDIQHADRAGMATLSMLWSVFATAVYAAAEAPGLFTGHAPGPDEWRWWLNLAFAVEIARRTLVLTLLFAYDVLKLPLDEALAAKRLEVRIEPRLTALGLAAACLAFLALERPLGVAGAAAAIVAASYPAAMLLERLSASSRPAGG
jgi:hypothetical protein